MVETSAASLLAGRLREIADGFGGVLGYSLHRLATGQVLEHRAEERFPTASTIKIPTLVTTLAAVQAGDIGYLDRKVFEEKYAYGGAGLLQHFQLGKELELKELVFLMMTVSDNAATLMVMDWVGIERINAYMRDLGLPDTRILSRLADPDAETRRLNEVYGWGMTTPRQMRQLVEWIATGAAGTPAATDEMQRILRREYFDGNAVAQHPPWVMVLHKSGSVDASRSAVFFVYAPAGAYVMSIYTRDNVDRQWTRDNEAEAAIRQMARAVWTHYQPEAAWAPPDGVEAF